VQQPKRQQTIFTAVKTSDVFHMHVYVYVWGAFNMYSTLSCDCHANQHFIWHYEAVLW